MFVNHFWCLGWFSRVCSLSPKCTMTPTTRTSTLLLSVASPSTTSMSLSGSTSAWLIGDSQYRMRNLTTMRADLVLCSKKQLTQTMWWVCRAAHRKLKLSTMHKNLNLTSSSSLISSICKRRCKFRNRLSLPVTASQTNGVSKSILSSHQ